MHRWIHEFETQRIVDGIYVVNREGRDANWTTLPLAIASRSARGWYDSNTNCRAAAENHDRELM